MQEHNYSIRQWAKDDKPREKLLLIGAENLSNSELLAILSIRAPAARPLLILPKRCFAWEKTTSMNLVA
jgi:DNA repair protein RadC